ncbi:MAG: N-acetyltransferase family protein [Acinetobacter sp.]
MNAEVSNTLADNFEKQYRSPRVPNFYVRAATQQDDAQLGKLISEHMPSNGMILSYERNPSYISASKTQYNRPDIRVVVPEHQPNKVVGMMNLGWKYCFVNGKSDVLRYVSDLRLDQDYRGQKILHLLMDYLQDELPKDGMLQSIVLEGNVAAREILHQKRKGFPTPYHYDDIQTFMVSQVPKPASYGLFKFERLTADKIPAVNDFVQSMQAHYNFLPNYDFSGLLDGQHAFWRGLKLEDFHLAYNLDNQLVGIYGLWNQKSFKQSRVVHYSWPMKFAKPFYNVYAQVKGALLLPKQDGAINYLMLHSALCHPQHLQVFSSLLYHAKCQMHQYRKRAFCITLAKNDPRIQQMQRTHSYTIQAIHSFHSFQGNPFECFDRSKISYFECGRI